MNFDYCVKQLRVNAGAVQAMLEGVDANQARWKPDAESWSMLEVINHLADEERHDFRARIRFVLAGAQGEPEPNDPQRWVTERGYNQRDLAASIADFAKEREDSLKWLPNVKDANWDAKYTASWGSISAGDFLVSWAAHDLLHLRQLVELKWTYGLRQYAPYNPGYAGDW
jgi:hypothetical protein